MEGEEDFVAAEEVEGVVTTGPIVVNKTRQTLNLTGCYDLIGSYALSLTNYIFAPDLSPPIPFYSRPYEQISQPKVEKDWETSSVASSGYGTDRESGGSRKRSYDDDKSSHQSKYRRDDYSSNLSR